ncbi:MAG: cytochrome c peroxidase [Prochloraceae cyanobacterium]|nr:cytochrome c peroxidase [Prochloraceae cyanobacterium]
MKSISFKTKFKQVIFVAIALLGLLILIWLRQPLTSLPSSDRLETNNISLEAIEEPIRPIPLKIPLNSEKVKLGEQLFYEVKLSKNETISCASCHNLKTGGTDLKSLAIGIDGAIGVFNTSTVFNSGFNVKQFWDGRADNLEEQIEETINSPNEMNNSSWQEAIDRIQQSAGYQASFKKIYNSKITSAAIKNALATYVNSLYTPNSRFDRFLRGDKTAITPREKQGYLRFKTLGCISCHQGVNLGGNMFQSFGVMTDYLEKSERSKETENPIVTQQRIKRALRNSALKERDDLLFKVPTMRNIALTKPYFHDGSAPTLEMAISVMGESQLGQELSPEDIKLIVEFLNTLTGEYQGKML